MSKGTQIVTSQSFSDLTRSINFDTTPTNKKNQESKKIFTRKPNKISNNCSRFASSRFKTQQIQQLNQQNNQLTQNNQKNETKQTQCLTFLSNKSSKSIEKLIFSSSSMKNLPVSKCKNSKQKRSEITGNFKINQKQDKNKKFFTRNGNKSMSSSLLGFHQKAVNFDKEFNDELELILKNQMVGSTELSSNEHVCISQFLECEQQQNDGVKLMTHSLLSSQKNKSYPKQCPYCSANEYEKIRLQKENQKLKSLLKYKQSQIKELNQKILIIEKNLTRTKNIKFNLESEIKVIKENCKIFQSQKEEVQKFNSKLQLQIKKLTQDLRYKDLEVNISKIYKTKSLELEFKVQNLKKELQRAKIIRNKIQSTKSSQNLRQFFMKRDYSNISLRTNLISQKNTVQKKPNIKRVYQEDILFSLSSESCD